MAALSRFYLAANAWQPQQLTLQGDEAIHCARVLRKLPGDHIEIFDGAGRVAQATLAAVSKNAVQASIDSVETHAPAAHPLHLYAAMIKTEPFEWLLEKAAELGAASIQPIITSRTIVHLQGEHLEKKLTKWHRHMVEAAKQCHTPWVPHLHAPLPFALALQAMPADSLRILPALSEHSRRIHELDLQRARPVCIVIGPEGDFTPDEEQLAQKHHCQPITLGPLILRAETAAMAALAMVGQEISRQDHQS
jgi:16S rRNA (uracil1498-N3)-methyltransferase